MEKLQSVSFNSCELFQYHESYVIEYEPGVNHINYDEINARAYAADYLTISIIMVPTETTADYTCSQMRSLMKTIEPATLMNNKKTESHIGGEILVNKNGCNFDPNCYEDGSKKGMYKDDSIWISHHGVKITLCR